MNFQNDVAEGEDACPESNYAIVEAEIVRHLQGRSGKIVAVKVSNHVKQEHIRQKTQGNPMAGTAGNVIDGNGWGRQFSFREDRISWAEHAARKITRLYTGPRAGDPGEVAYQAFFATPQFPPRRDSCRNQAFEALSRTAICEIAIAR